MSPADLKLHIHGSDRHERKYLAWKGVIAMTTGALVDDLALQHHPINGRERVKRSREEDGSPTNSQMVGTAR